MPVSEALPLVVSREPISRPPPALKRLIRPPSAFWLPSEAVARTTIVWLPTERLVSGRLPPVPSTPSRLDVHCSERSPRNPSSGSYPNPCSQTRSPLVNDAPVCGEVTSTSGG